MRKQFLQNSQHQLAKTIRRKKMKKAAIMELKGMFVINPTILLLLGLAIILSSCARELPPESREGSFYPLEVNEESTLVLSAERYKVVKEEGYWNVWDEELEVFLKICTTKEALMGIYAEYFGEERWNVISKEEIVMMLGDGSAKGILKKQRFKIDGRQSMMLRGKDQDLLSCKILARNESSMKELCSTWWGTGRRNLHFFKIKL